MEVKIITNSMDETMDLAKSLADHLFPSLVITLTGDLGAGKTTFVKGLASAMGVKEKVTSPTFNILKCYFLSPLDLYHIDAYRLDSGNKDIGLEEFIEGEGVTVIEWPNFISEMIPSLHLEVNITSLGDNKREIVFKSEIASLSPFFDTLKERNND